MKHPVTTMTKRQKTLAYTECKTYNHWMGEAPPSTPTSVEFGLVLRCDRCTTIRHIEMNPNTGEIVTSNYDWPDDYRDFGVKLTKTELRLARAKARKPAKRRKAAA